MPADAPTQPSTSLARALAYLDVPGSLRPPIWRELSPGLLRPPPRRPASVPPTARRNVVLVPGFLAPDQSTAVLAAAIRDAGHRAHHARLGSTSGCNELLASALVARLDALAAAGATRLTLVGHSRGGQLAKVAARRRPDLVDGLITLGAPLTDPWGMHLSVKLVVVALRGLGRRGLAAGGCGDADCPFGRCSAAYFDDLAGDLSAHVRFTSLYSRRDGIVQWRTCLDPSAVHVEVQSSHLEMAVDPHVVATVLRELAQTPDAPGATP